ncbi:MAG: D-arabinono-1,4-lactone oxidase, partial [Thermomicrobiales bacterium]
AERLFVAHGGRPHWGKLQYLDADGVAACYPASSLDAFRAVRRALDPLGCFANGYLRSLGLAD